MVILDYVLVKYRVNVLIYIFCHFSYLVEKTCINYRSDVVHNALQYCYNHTFRNMVKYKVNERMYFVTHLV